jgi:hypothetical protein
MTIQISIAILLALFVLVGAKKMHRQTGHPAEVVIVAGKPYTWVGAKDNRDTLVLMASEQNANKVIIRGGNSNETFENIFREVGLDRLIEEGESLPEEGTSANNYITRNTEQTVFVSVK